MKNVLKEKSFTILLSIIYIIALIGVFYNFEILDSFIVLIFLISLILFFNFDYKKAIVLYFIFFVGIFNANNSKKLNSPFDEINANNAIIKGQIISSKDISIKNQKTKFYLNTSNAEIYGKNYNNLKTKILVSIDYDEEINNKIIIGNYISIQGKLRTPIVSSNPYQFDYRKYLLNNDCEYILYGENNSLKTIKTIDFKGNYNDKWYYILQKFEDTRNKIILKHSKNIKSPKLEILGGIVFGNETINPDETIKEQFKASGLLHLLAASGLNVALIYGIWWWIASLIRFPYNLSIIIGALFVILYTFMTGFPPSILRASIMLLFVLFGKLIDRKTSSLALIFFVGFLILLFNPKMLFDIGFQLSFMVTIGLITCCPVIIEKFDKIDEKFKEKYKNSSRIEKYFRFLFSPKNLVSIITVPLIAQVWVIPLQMHYFNNLAVLSILANICTVPFIGILSFIGFISSIIALIPAISDKLVYLFDLIANPMLALLIKISEIFSSYKYSLISTIGLNFLQIFLYWTIVIILMFNISSNFKNKKYLISLFAILIIFLMTFINIENFNKTPEIIMFDVQNADSFLIKSPKHKYIMIDTGKKSYKGTTDAQIILNRYLHNKKINSLDTLIVTHFDNDHCGGVVDILENFKVKNVIIQNEKEKSQISKNILDYLKNNNINYKIAKNNEIIFFEKDFNLKTLTPTSISNNESSIITLLNYKNKNVLFMADSGIEGFNQIKKYLPNNIDIIKIGHHGAKNTINQNMINEIKPKYALISTGINKFNHPNPMTLNVLYTNDIKTLLTRNYGFIKIRLKENENEIYHFNSENKKIEKIEFKQNNEIPFHKSKFMLDFIKENS